MFHSAGRSRSAARLAILWGLAFLLPPGMAGPADAQGPSPATEAMVLSDTNSAAGQTASFLDPAALDGLGFHGYPIEALFVIDAVGARDEALRTQPVGAGCNAYDAVANGTFFQANPIRPVTPLVRLGRLDGHDANDFALRRGAVAVRADGTIVVGRTDGLTAAELEARFGGELREFMGGGILLIEDGQPVSLRDVVFNQYAQNKPSDRLDTDWDDLVDKGVWPDQCRPVAHSVVAVRQGQAYLLVAKRLSCADIRDRLLAAGFGAAVMFDGGSATYLKDSDAGLRFGDAAKDANFTGIGIYQRRAGQAGKAARCPTPPNRCGLGAPLAGNKSTPQSFDFAPGGGCPMAPVEAVAAAVEPPLGATDLPLPRADALPASCKAAVQIGPEFERSRYKICDPDADIVYSSCWIAHCVTAARVAEIQQETPDLTAEKLPSTCAPACDEDRGFALRDLLGHDGRFCGRCPEGLRYHRGYGCCR